MSSLAGALSGGGGTYASDEDPELVREALPFALKTYESVLEETPRHRQLLTATAKGFAVYAYGYLARDAELQEDESLARSLATRRRARRMLIRSRDYALRALEVRHPGIAAALRAGDGQRLVELDPIDQPAAFWSGAAWGGAIAILKDDADLLGDLPIVEALLRRSIELDDTFEMGYADELMVALEAGLAGGSVERAREHFARAVELSRGRSASVYVTFAENIAVKEQDYATFQDMLSRALAVDVEGEKSLRVANLLAQERARWLMGRAELLFIDAP